ncbi:MAG TPA: hypothetical protein VGN09_06475 [Vicinamibacteria bacterium]
MTQEPRLIWSFWAAAALAAAGGAIPFLIGGSSSRIANVFIPFAIAALAFAACALVHEQGRAMTSGLYLLAGLAIVYGVLTMFALPLMLAVLGTCPPPPTPCTGGLERSLTVGENTGIGFAAAFGLAALFVGFFGLVVVYRRTAARPAAPPVRSIPPVDSTRPAAPVVEPAPAAENGADPAATAEPSASAEPPVAEEEPAPELPAHEEEERPELPPHVSKPPSS